MHAEIGNSGLVWLSDDHSGSESNGAELPIPREAGNPDDQAEVVFRFVRMARQSNTITRSSSSVVDAFTSAR
jgi:hypothetical protein